MSEYDEMFAEVVNGLTGGRRSRQRSEDADTAELVDLVDMDTVPTPLPNRFWPGYVAPESSIVDHPMGIEQAAVDAGVAGDASIVRPYSWTRGRTRAPVDLRIEALVSTSARGANIETVTHTEHRVVAELCREPRSVAEVATLLRVPLGVAKVLVGDMANLGLVIVHRTATGGANKAHLLLMERVLSGLRRL